MFNKLAHLFTPHHSNNHRPKVLHHLSLAMFISLLVISQASVSLITQLYPQILGYASQIPPDTIITLTNQKRAEAGVGPVTYDPQLADAARRKAADMFAKNYWAHNSPDGTKPWFFITAAGYNYLHAGENLARDFNNPNTVVDAWMASPTHKENLLNGRYTDIGIAVVDGQLGGVETTLVVQMFGTPQSNQTITDTSTNTSLAQPVLAQEQPQPEVASQATSNQEAEDVLPLPTPTPIAQITNDITSDLNTFAISKIVSLAFIILITLVLAIDWLIAYQKNLIRISGRNWAHITYIVAVAIIILIIKQGIIL